MDYFRSQYARVGLLYLYAFFSKTTDCSNSPLFSQILILNCWSIAKLIGILFEASRTLSKNQKISKLFSQEMQEISRNIYFWKTVQYGTVVSPGWPKMYPNNVNCYWDIKCHGMQEVNIVFKSLDIEKSSECK